MCVREEMSGSMLPTRQSVAGHQHLLVLLVQDTHTQKPDYYTAT